MRRIGGIISVMLVSGAAFGQSTAPSYALELTAQNTKRPMPRPASFLEVQEAEADIPVPAVVASSEMIEQDWKPLILRNLAFSPFEIEASSDVKFSNLSKNLTEKGFVTSSTDFEVALNSLDGFRTPRADDPITHEIFQHLSAKYDLSQVDGEEGYQRLIDMAENKPHDKVNLEISSDNFVFDNETSSEMLPPEGTIAEGAAPAFFNANQGAVDPVASFINSLNKEQLSVMSPDQLGAIVTAARGGQVPETIAPAVVAQAQPAVLNGVPSLDFKGEVSDLAIPQPQVISANDVPEGANPFSQEQVPQQVLSPQPAYNPMPTPSQVAQMIPAQVGDGKSMILKGWKLGMTGDGGIGMYIEGDPGSIIEISEGMVVGPLGPVERIMMENGSIMARFASGDVITSPATLVNMTSS